MSSVFPQSNIKPAFVGQYRQKGAALILALVVVTVVVLVASTLSSDFFVTYKRVENQLYSQQASAYMRGSEGLAREVLLADFNDDKNSVLKDHRSEGLGERVEYPMEQGVIAGTLCDLQGRFNLNNLQRKASGTLVYTPDQELFIRLLQTLDQDNGIDQQQAEDITAAVIDWIDADSDVSGVGGAEDSYYSELDVPMHAGNQAMHSASELRVIKGITPSLYKRLLPHVTALPIGVPLNVNSASLNIIRAINEPGVLEAMSESEAQAIINERDGDIEADVASALNQGFDDLPAFVASHPATSLETGSFSTNSEYFLLQTETIFLDKLYTLYSVLNRDTSGISKTIARGTSGLGVCTAKSYKS